MYYIGSQRWNMQYKLPEVEYKYARQIIFDELHVIERFCLNNWFKQYFVLNEYNVCGYSSSFFDDTVSCTCTQTCYLFMLLLYIDKERFQKFIET